MMHAAIANLRQLLQQHQIGAYLVPRADEHLGEYVPPEAERLAFISGFTGSAGLAVILPDQAVLFIDGRYTLQAGHETDSAIWQRQHLIENPAPAWLKQQRPDGVRVGYDPMLFSADQIKRFADAGHVTVPIEPNLVDLVWPQRPEPVIRAAQIHDLRYAGIASDAKRNQIASALRAAGEDAAVLTDPASICWLFNIRGTDLDFTPFLLAFALIHADGTADLIVEPAKITPEVASWLGDRVRIVPRAALRATLEAMAGKTIRVDPAGSPSWFGDVLRGAGATVVAGSDPCALPKATKNDAEQQGARHAHQVDAVAVTRFLHWLSDAQGETELSAAARLRSFRAEGDGFRDESFPAISGAGPHGAIVHYRVTPKSDRAILPGDVYLIDSGGQYPSGTTDITRTVWIGPDQPSATIRHHYTLVLQGHLSLGHIQFPEGLSGGFLDSLARAPLWRAGLDYDHGTGHGVGSYLSVHEGPAGISRAARPVPLAPGMVISNEPGFYPGDYGIRIENLVLVLPVEAVGRKFLGFETLTLVPYDRRLIDREQLSAQERRWVDDYHARVLTEIGPLVPSDTLAWLRAACAPL